MSSDKQKSLEAMRTFARDLEREREASGLTDDVKDEAGKKADKEAAKETKGAEKNNEPKETPKLKAQKGPNIKAVPKKDKGEVPAKKKGFFLNKKDKEKLREKEAKSSEPKRIPAFHELQKVVETNIKADEKKKEVPKAKKAGGIEPTKRVGGGTVITDTKKERRPLFPQIAKSFKNWLEGIKKSLKPKEKNTYEVSQTNRRKGVVQKATSKTGTIFSADGDTLKEQIRARQRAEKHDQDDEDLSWSPYTEPGFPLLEGDEVESVDPRVTKVSVAKKTTSQPKPVIKSAAKIPELHEKKEEATLEALVEETGAKIPEEPVKIVPPPPPIKERAVEKETGAVDDTSEGSGLSFIERLRGVPLEDTNTLAMLLVGIVLAIAIFGLVLFRIFDVDNSGSVVEEVPESAIYSGASLDTIQIKNRSFNEVLTQTNSVLLDGGSGSREYKYVRGDGEPLAGAVVMHLIQTEPTDGFANAVTDVRLVKTSNDFRALILTTTDSTLARGGMLSWEPDLLSDLGVLLKLSSVPPNAGQFADKQFGSLDVRALMYGDEQLLVYAVVNESDVIITSDMSVLTPFMEN